MEHQISDDPYRTQKQVQYLFLFFSQSPVVKSKEKPVVVEQKLFSEAKNQ